MTATVPPVGSVAALSLDPSVRRAGDGRVLLGGSPLVLLRLTASGAELIDRIARGDTIEPTPATSALLDRLLDAGLVQPRPPIGVGPPVSDVTVVIPAFDTAPRVLDAIVADCGATAAVVIVDDASSPPIAPVVGACLVRRSLNGGPGAARSTGLEHVNTAFVAFVDADVVLSPGWLDGILAHFADERVALVAPRVASAPGGTCLARYEAARSPLDLGAVPARVRSGTRVSYVPSAAIVCRVDALHAIGGFDASLRYGEDVDLVWRLDEAGWRVRYEPTIVVSHEPRRTWRAWAAQRFRYGGSAAPLATRHPGALAPVRVSRWSALSWLAIAAGWPVVGTVVAAATTALLARKLRTVPDGTRLTVRLAGLGHLHAGRSLAAAITRVWWPLAVLAALISRRCRRAVLAAAVIPPALDWLRTRPPVHPVGYIALRVIDDMSYGAGLLAGVVRERSFEALRPDLTSWPNRSNRSNRP